MEHILAKNRHEKLPDLFTHFSVSEESGQRRGKTATVEQLALRFRTSLQEQSLRLGFAGLNVAAQGLGGPLLFFSVPSQLITGAGEALYSLSRVDISAAYALTGSLKTSW